MSQGGIETTAEEVLQECSHEDLNAKRLEWRVADHGEPAKEHSVKHYRLVAASLVLVDMRDGKQRRLNTLDKIWRYADTEDRFRGCVRDEVLAFLRDANR